jgi:hypothetical protein
VLGVFLETQEVEDNLAKMGNKENLVKVVFLVLMEQLEKLVNLVLLETQDLLEKKETKDCQETRGHQETQDYEEIQVGMVHKDPRDQLDQKEIGARMVRMEDLVRMASMELQDLKDHREQEALRDLWACQDQWDHRDHLDLL